MPSSGQSSAELPPDDAAGAEALVMQSLAAAAGAVVAQPVSDTVAEWLERLAPAPPPALLARLRELLAPHFARPATDAPAACLEAGETQLKAMLSTRATDRGSALDLLAVDALVTYAFEAASDTPGELERLATEAMVRIAEISEAP